MSKYIFIASDFEIPEVDLTNEQIITPIDIKLIKPIELYSIWLDEKVDVEYSTVFIDNLNEEIILNIINNYHSSLIIK